MEIMAEKTFEERKKILYEFINDPHYMPMKQKELAILLQVAKEDRAELSRSFLARERFLYPNADGMQRRRLQR